MEPTHCDDDEDGQSHVDHESQANGFWQSANFDGNIPPPLPLPHTYIGASICAGFGGVCCTWRVLASFRLPPRRTVVPARRWCLWRGGERKILS